MATKIIIPTKDAPIRRVVLYADGAEVTRRMHITPESTGFHDIKIEGVTTSAQKESIRVRGTGNCVINEVSTNDVIKKSKVQNICGKSHLSEHRIVEYCHQFK
eukprot:GHVP01036905.1.p1 GENE.GHVP01036905.1~~GHVP01036905.1.p1  ORF type:complete len:103 (-),score=9.63 GHVP01036905.1:320-628(-)